MFVFHSTKLGGISFIVRILQLHTLKLILNIQLFHIRLVVRQVTIHIRHREAAHVAAHDVDNFLVPKKLATKFHRRHHLLAAYRPAGTASRRYTFAGFSELEGASEWVRVSVVAPTIQVAALPKRKIISVTSRDLHDPLGDLRVLVGPLQVDGFGS